MVQKGSGNFEIVEGGAAIVTGKIFVPEDINKEIVNLEPPEEESDPNLLPMSSKDFYKELRLRGYNYKGLFRSITKANNEGLRLLSQVYLNFYKIYLRISFYSSEEHRASTIFLQP